MQPKRTRRQGPPEINTQTTGTSTRQFEAAMRDAARIAANPANDKADDKPTKRQRIINTLKDGLPGFSIAAGLIVATSTGSLPIAAGALLFSGGLMTSCLQQAKQFENHYPRDDDDQPGAGNPGLAI